MSAQLCHFMDAITCWSTDCITDMTPEGGGLNLYSDQDIVKSQYAVSLMRRSTV
jgi:hypothetical protein